MTEDDRGSRVAVVTGASRGLGEALAAELSTRGYWVGACATTMPTVNAVVCRSVDVTDAVALSRFAAEVATELGPIDLWLNNAGVIGPVGPFRRADASSWERAVAVNLIGVVNGSRAFLENRSSGWATLINIASRAGVTPAAGLAAYSATKAAVIALTQSIQEESASGLRAHAVIPPSIDTAMQHTLLSASEYDYPLVHVHHARSRDGGIVTPAMAAALILDAVLRDVDDVIIDLTGTS